ncbi:MAG: HD family phosphohydrolase [Actinobacteria bacterium]|nr:HD family phosphohydrolase [Actinomycetota bacterium]
MQDLQDCVNNVWEVASDLYARQTRKVWFWRKVTFHGWPHVSFVAKNAHKFAFELDADPSVAEIAGLVHDTNYLVTPRGPASEGSRLRAKVLVDAGLDKDSISVIENVVISAETRSRGRNISREAMALSDADTLFKALPITPVILSPLYMRETGRSLRELAEKIVGEQVPLRDEEIYFYSESAKKSYEKWGDANLRLWSYILESLDDPSVVDLVEQMEDYTKIPARASSKEHGVQAALSRVRNGLRN